MNLQLKFKFTITKGDFQVSDQKFNPDNFRLLGKSTRGWGNPVSNCQFPGVEGVDKRG